MYVGGTSGVELTQVSGFLKTLEGKHDISNMNKKDCTIKDQLYELGVKLNIATSLFGWPYSVATRRHKKRTFN